jgi:hypothetical protein
VLACVNAHCEGLRSTPDSAIIRRPSVLSCIGETITALQI